jgi:hypothetical protein
MGELAEKPTSSGTNGKWSYVRFCRFVELGIKGKSQIVRYRGGIISTHEKDVLSDFSALVSDPCKIFAISLPVVEKKDVTPKVSWH